MVYQGSCLCGEVQYEIDGDIGETGFCHCTMCQKQHGAPFGPYSSVQWDDFTVTHGESFIKGYRSSEIVTRTFCSECGSTLQFIRDNKPSFGLAVSTLDTPFTKTPDIQIYTADKAPWWTLTPEPPCYATYPGGPEPTTDREGSTDD